MSNHFTLKPSALPGGRGGPSASDYRIAPPNVDLSSIPDYLKKDCLLFYYPDCEALARNIVEVSAGSVELADINWKRFADGFPNLFVKDAIRIRNRHVAFLASFHSPEVIFEQARRGAGARARGGRARGRAAARALNGISIIYQLPRLFVGSFTLVLPYFPTGTAERVEAEGDVATAFTLARIISNIPLARGGPASVVIFDIHALQARSACARAFGREATGEGSGDYERERFYFGDQVLPLFESGIPLLRQRLCQLPDAANITIAYPDEGAWKRFHYQFGDYPEGAAAVSAYVTHGVFPSDSFQRFQCSNGGPASDGFAYFWITDSCPRTVASVTDRRARLPPQKPFEVLSLAEPIAAALQI
eukprot:scaffold14.g1310.t1